MLRLLLYFSVKEKSIAVDDQQRRTFFLEIVLRWRVGMNVEPEKMNPISQVGPTRRNSKRWRTARRISHHSALCVCQQGNRAAMHNEMQLLSSNSSLCSSSPKSVHLWRTPRSFALKALACAVASVFFKVNLREYVWGEGLPAMLLPRELFKRPYPWTAETSFWSFFWNSPRMGRKRIRRDRAVQLKCTSSQSPKAL